jgi:hypothetical protein
MKKKRFCSLRNVIFRYVAIACNLFIYFNFHFRSGFIIIQNLRNKNLRKRCTKMFKIIRKENFKINSIDESFQFNWQEKRRALTCKVYR